MRDFVHSLSFKGVVIVRGKLSDDVIHRFHATHNAMQVL